MVYVPVRNVYSKHHFEFNPRFLATGPPAGQREFHIDVALWRVGSGGHVWLEKILQSHPSWSAFTIAACTTRKLTKGYKLVILHEGTLF